MNITSAVPAVTDYLVAAATAALPGVVVFDGPNPTADTLTEPQHLWIGWDTQGNSGEPAAETAQDWPVMDYGRTKDEDGMIICTADAWGGSVSVKTHRDAAAGIVAGVELLLRGTPQAGGPGDASMGGLVLWSGVNGPYQWYPRQTQSGAGCGVVFRIVYKARLVIT